MLPKDKQLIQELLAHPGWDIYKNLVLGRLKEKLRADQLSAGRAGDGVKGAYYAGQQDIITVILEVPEKYLKER